MVTLKSVRLSISNKKWKLHHRGELSNIKPQVNFYRVKLAHSIVFVTLFVLVSIYCPTNRIGTRQNFFTFYKVNVQESWLLIEAYSILANSPLNYFNKKLICETITSKEKSNTFYGELEAVVKKFILVNFSINDKMTALYTGVDKIYQFFMKGVLWCNFNEKSLAWPLIYLMVKLTACSLMKRLIFASFTSSATPARSSIGENFNQKTSTSVTDIIIHKAGNFFYGASSLVVMKSGFWNFWTILL